MEYSDLTKNGIKQTKNTRDKIFNNIKELNFKKINFYVLNLILK